MQNEGKHTLCHLCLRSCECTFECVEALTMKMLRFLGLELNLDINRRPVTCRICSDNLQKCFSFKTICIYTEECINSFRGDKNNVNLDLWEIYLRKNESKDITLSKCHTVCRLCMEIAEANCYIPLNDETKDVMSAKTILEKYFLEIDMDIIKNPVICISCNESLYSYFIFLKSCSEMENKLKKDSEIERKNKSQEESKSLLRFAAENVPNYESGRANMNTPKNCYENELKDKIKMEYGYLAQRESQQLHVKHEVNEHEEGSVKLENLNDDFEKYYENGQNCKTELKCEQSVETENKAINIKHEEIHMKTEEDNISR